MADPIADAFAKRRLLTMQLQWQIRLARTAIARRRHLAKEIDQVLAKAEAWRLTAIESC